MVKKAHLCFVGTLTAQHSFFSFHYVLQGFIYTIALIIRIKSAKKMKIILYKSEHVFIITFLYT